MLLLCRANLVTTNLKHVNMFHSRRADRRTRVNKQTSNCVVYEYHVKVSATYICRRITNISRDFYVGYKERNCCPLKYFQVLGASAVYAQKKSHSGATESSNVFVYKEKLISSKLYSIRKFQNGPKAVVKFISCYLQLQPTLSEKISVSNPFSVPRLSFWKFRLHLS